MEMKQILMTPFSWLLTFFHDTLGNYGIALILFAVVVKLILYPFSLKSKRSMIQQSMVQDKVQRIQKQYANNREKMNEEVQKLYAKENINPMSGCLWSMIPLFILWPLYAIIRRPLYYLMGQSEAAIEAIQTALNFTAEGSRASAYSELYMASMINDANINGLRDVVEGVTSGLGDKLFVMNFNFLGMNLTQVAEWKIWTVSPLTWGAIGLFLLPIISAVLSFLMSKVSQATNRMNKSQENSQMNQQMKSMFILMPLMSLWIGYAMPAGLCVYWIINNLLAMLQEVIAARMLRKDYAKAAAKKEEQERLEKEEEKRKKREAAERRAKAIEDAKNNKGKKKHVPAEKPEKKKDRTTDVGRIGMRPYARGRSYDPERFGGVTPYQDPGAPIDEVAVAEALAAKGMLPEEEPEQSVAEAIAVEETAEQVGELAAEEAAEATTEATEDTAEDAE